MNRLWQVYQDEDGTTELREINVECVPLVDGYGRATEVLDDAPVYVEGRDVHSFIRPGAILKTGKLKITPLEGPWSAKGLADRSGGWHQPIVDPQAAASFWRDRAETAEAKLEHLYEIATEAAKDKEGLGFSPNDMLAFARQAASMGFTNVPISTLTLKLICYALGADKE